MKTGMTLSAFAAEISRQNAAKRDFKAPSSKLEVVTTGTPVLSPEGFKMQFSLNLEGKGLFPMRKLFHQQLAERTKIPWNYYERLLDEIDCGSAKDDPLPYNVNYWLEKQNEVRLVRTLDGQARAYLGDKYRPLDNFDLFKAIAPVLMGAQNKGMRIESIQITETRFYVKAFSERITGEVKLNDVVQAGVVITNSEVGHSQISIEPAFYRLVCYNGMIRPDASLKRRHVGRGVGEMENVEEFFSDATRRADDEAFWRKVVDVARGSFEETRFREFIEKMRAAADNAIPKGGASLQEVQEVVQSKYGLTGIESDDILRNLINGGDLSQYGLANAITLTAQDDGVTYERATELERLGGQVIELSQRDWRELVAA
jgi:hypothetical protein